MKPIAVGLLGIVAASILLTGCERPKQIAEQNIDIAGSTYQVAPETITQTKSSFLTDGEIKIGVVSDLEGAVENAKTSAARLKAEHVDAIVIAGDLYENEQIRVNPSYKNSTDNVREMEKDIEPYAGLGVPVFIIPGNHESRAVYEKALTKIHKNHNNVFDINHKTADLQGINIVGLGGYHDARFIAREGFILNDADYERASKKLQAFQQQKEPTVLVTHGPPKSTGSIDYVAGFGNVGDEKLAGLLGSNLQNIINVHGHIHEGGGSVAQYGNNSAVNVASITDYARGKGRTGGIIIIKDGNVSYQDLP